MEKKVQSIVLEAIVSAGKAEQKASRETKEAVLILKKEGIKDEQSLFQWALDNGHWQEKWPRPRSLWQEVSRGRIKGGKSCSWTITSQSVVFDWKENSKEYTKKVSLSLVAGLGRLCARLAVAQSRQRERTDTSEGETGKGKGKGGKEKLLAAEVETAKEEVAKAKKEADDARKELLVQKTAFESGLLKNKAVKAAKKQTDAALAALEENKTASAKVRKERDMKEAMLLSIANSVNKASIDAPKEELWSILLEIKAALAGKPLEETRQEMP